MKLKAVSEITLTLLFVGALTLAFNIQPVKAEPKTWTVDDDGPADFRTIQKAINTASAGDTIFVYNGTYYERVVVNKTVSLVGENRDLTIVRNTSRIFDVLADNVVVSGFTLESAGALVLIDERFGVTFSGNLLIAEKTDAVSVEGGSHNRIVNNTILILAAEGAGVSIVFDSTDNVIDGNKMVGGLRGVYLAMSQRNLIVNNTIRDTVTATWGEFTFGAAIETYESSFNVIYHNNFINNTRQVFDLHWINPNLSSSVNVWDDGYPSGGNYWSDYIDADLYSGPYQNETGSDGIWDHPYIIDEDNKDNLEGVDTVSTINMVTCVTKVELAQCCAHMSHKRK